MGIDKDNIQTQEETGEPAAIDQVEGRVEDGLRFCSFQNGMLEFFDLLTVKLDARQLLAD